MKLNRVITRDREVKNLSSADDRGPKSLILQKTGLGMKVGNLISDSLIHDQSPKSAAD